MALMLHLIRQKGLEGSSAVDIDKLQNKENMHYDLLGGKDSSHENVIPLEDALLLNEPYTRRSMMLNVLYEDPDEYYELLEEARMNDDGEIVHYATTAMAELAKEYDFRLQKMEQVYAAHSNDLELLKEYCSFLDEYIRRGFVQGQMEQMQRRHQVKLLSRLCSIEPSPENDHQLIHALVTLKEFSQACDVLNLMKNKWPNHEKTIMAQLEYAVRQGDQEQIQNLITYVNENDVFLSASAREKLSFFV